MTAAQTVLRLLDESLPRFTSALEEVPDDKLDWKPAPGARSALQVAQEVVMMFGYTTLVLGARAVVPYHEMNEKFRVMSREELLATLPKSLEEYRAAVLAFPESDYDQVLEAPWGKMTYFENLSYPGWNLVWHTGQINYIQTLYGG